MQRQRDIKMAEILLIGILLMFTISSVKTVIRTNKEGNEAYHLNCDQDH